MTLNGIAISSNNTEFLRTQNSVEPLQQRLRGWCAMGGLNSRPLPCQEGEITREVDTAGLTKFPRRPSRRYFYSMGLRIRHPARSNRFQKIQSDFEPPKI